MKYILTNDQLKELENRYTHHPPKGDQAERYVKVRAEILATAVLICEHVPDCRERSIALTHLDSAMMFANAAIARNE